MKTYKELKDIQDREAGNKIAEVSTRKEAENKLSSYEEADKKEGTYSPDFYEIIEKVFIVEEYGAGSSTVVLAYEEADEAGKAEIVKNLIDNFDYMQIATDCGRFSTIDEAKKEAHRPNVYFDIYGVKKLKVDFCLIREYFPNLEDFGDIDIIY